MFLLRQVPIKNIKAHPVRFGILAALTMLQQICLFTGLALVLSLRQELELAQSRLGADVLIYPSQAMSKISKDGLLMQGTPVEVYKNRSMLSRIDDCDHIKGLSWQIYISDGTYKITGYEPETDFVISPWLSEGSRFIPSEGSVVVGSGVSVPVNDRLTIFRKEWPVSGHLLETGSELDNMIFVSMDTLRMLLQASEEAGNSSFLKIDPKTMFSAALVKADDKQNVESVTNWINIYIRRVTAIRSDAALAKTAADIQKQSASVFCIAGVLWAVLLLALLIVQSILMKQRRKELHVWSVIGASRKKTEAVIFREAFITHGCGVCAGIFVSFVLYFLLCEKLFPETVLSVSALILISLGAGLVMTAVGCLSACAAERNVLKTTEGQMLLNI
ncbi:MAG: ABC transporter permease [Anaerolineaceae bacterium]|nr:ABC transporter permease [Anaerolineaceae bacterium]